MSSSLLFASCNDDVSLGDNFEVSYVDIVDNRNVYYNHQGIFSSLGVNQIIYNDDKILVRGYLYNYGNPGLDNSHYIYYLIDKKAYMTNPTQQSSTGVIGPIQFEHYRTISKGLENAKTKSW
ncbi:MAG: hypothetical protein EOO93_08215 [Pedobacter sp.]|nr:MAG: hypothetical protein EOO93_08215 [Pedobacter sp.]